LREFLEFFVRSYCYRRSRKGKAGAAGVPLRTHDNARPWPVRQVQIVLGRRPAVTYDELAGAPLQAENTEASSELRPRVAA